MEVVVTPALMNPLPSHARAQSVTAAAAVPLRVALRWVSDRTGGTPGAGMKSLKHPTRIWSPRPATTPDTTEGSGCDGLVASWRKHEPFSWNLPRKVLSEIQRRSSILVESSRSQLFVFSRMRCSHCGRCASTMA